MKQPFHESIALSTFRILKGRGATYNPKNKFEKQNLEVDNDYLEFSRFEDEDLDIKTEFLEIHPKTIINKVPSIDVPMDYSINPYQGCEHGCSYCYARPTHEYWGYSAGFDFESKILIKKNAADLLRKELIKKAYVPKPIMLSGNTDCYQPCEREYQITRKLLDVMNEFNQPTGIITKNSLILRDLDILKSMAERNLIVVTLSITSLNEKTRRVLEPRTSSARNKLKTIEKLAMAGVPVRVNLAPIIPAINDFELPELLQSVKDAGAYDASMIMVRLNNIVADVFENWLREAFPDRANKVLELIRDVHGGSLGSFKQKERMLGSGNIADQIKSMFNVLKKRHFPDPEKVVLDTSAFKKTDKGQFKMF